ncbi:3-hydroxyacyl-CoA dehydrogenase NAD-binding domain-containing protein [Candidatus Puniceispirillum sp.]|nr:3-hydroxyacyl-CoA dehydrogenase NAD-binding domain-containing protein [Candidatus Puniceispirillum sp.]
MMDNIMQTLNSKKDHMHWRANVDEDSIAWLRLQTDGKSVNVLTHAVMTELESLIDQLESSEGLAGVGLLSGKPGGFIYGADINEFETLKTADDVADHMRYVHSLFNRIEVLPLPSCVGVDGIAVGGGLEIALVFDRLFVTSSLKTKLGFPEVNLGIMPGYGGTGRAYCRIGTKAVLDMMVSGRPLGSQDAIKTGLADDIVDNADDLEGAMREWILGCKREKPILTQLETTPNAKAIAAARDKYLKRVRADHTPAPAAIIDHVENFGHDKTAMSAGEMNIFPNLLVGSASKNLRRVFSLTDAVRKSARGVSGIERLHVVGAGVMGGDIAAIGAMAGLDVTLADMNEAAIENAITRAAKLFERRLKDENKVAAALERLRSDPDGHGSADADLIIEAVAEKLDVKQAVFQNLENVCKTGAILATNTSAIPLEDIATALNAPERLIGLHFFNPVPVLPLVEVIWSKYSDQDMVNRGMQFAGQIGKMPVRCKSAPGFLVNRALLPYIFKAIEAVAGGENADHIDEALVDFGMPMGPVELADQIGLDVCLDAGIVLGIAPAAKTLLDEKCKAGTIGRKSGSGFYEWDGNQAIRARQSQDPSVMATIAKNMLTPMIEECRQAVDEQVVDSADSADAGMIFGIGFPGFRGGPLNWAKEH